MKRKGVTKQTIAKYLAAFMAIKNEIDHNPKTKSISKIADSYGMGKQPIAMLKKSGVIAKSKNGMFWVGEQPSVKMVIQITDLVHQYHVDLRIRKITDGDLFKRRSPKHIHIRMNDNVPRDRGLSDDEQPITISSGATFIPKQPIDWDKPMKTPFCKTIQEIEQTPLKNLEQSDLENWRELYSKQLGQPSGIFIVQPQPDTSMISEFVDHHQDSLNKVIYTEKQFESNPDSQLNWFQKLIKLIFKIK